MLTFPLKNRTRLWLTPGSSLAGLSFQSLQMWTALWWLRLYGKLSVGGSRAYEKLFYGKRDACRLHIHGDTAFPRWTPCSFPQISMSWRFSNCKHFFPFPKVLTKLSWSSCIRIGPSEKPGPWSATRYRSHTRTPWVGVHPITLLQNSPLGIFLSLPLSPWVTTGPIKAFGTLRWLLAKDTTSTSKPWAVWRRWDAVEIWFSLDRS